MSSLAIIPSSYPISLGTPNHRHPTTPRHPPSSTFLPQFKSIIEIYSRIKSTSAICKLTRRCEFFDLHNHIIPYKEAWEWQKSIVKAKKEMIQRNEECPDTLIILQHTPVYTLGTRSSVEYLNFDVEDSPCDVYRTERGGEVTYHGPGQLVMYPIINLRNHKMDLHWYLRTLEEVVIRVLSTTFSINASRVEGLTGVWVGDEKVAAMGIRVSRWITYHGLALNVSMDLAPFDRIIPCGIRNRRVGSIKGLIGKASEDIENGMLIDITLKSLMKHFSEVFNLGLEYKSSQFSDKIRDRLTLSC